MVTVEVLAAMMLATLLVGCEPPARPPGPEKPARGDILERPQTRLPARETAWPDDAWGQSVYVPVYSQLLTMTALRFYSLTGNVVVHNTDPDHPITLMSARYYGNGGKLLTEYLEEPRSLAPFSSTTLLVEQVDREGGIGANFVIDWMADSPVSSPAIEAVMIGEAGTQGLAFVSPGHVIREYAPKAPASL